MSFNPYNPEPYSHPGPCAYTPINIDKRRPTIKTRFNCINYATHTEPAAYTLKSCLISRQQTISQVYKPLTKFVTPAPSRDFQNIFSERGKVYERCGIDYQLREKSQVPAFYNIKSELGTKKRSIHQKCKNGILLI
ncbi:hypothetical protein SS50377_25795 [Spironucleus salmonicida]|uniref:Uncharacterized protein n=1 Tax=Spironucleus salmonicida TaxID=348837 RepID=V6M4I0_9EUKA|nr:hypothetical protein SS50377_25795 [Spironucleus salmonicida]|eukprot:EST48229.1 Hypothetical protein SS50377_11571 [Spironucleus salmonicida]